MGSHLNRPIYPPEEKFVWFQTPIQTGGVRHANVPWMIHIFGSGADEHIELSMWLRALTAQAQRRNYQGRALPTELIARRASPPLGAHYAKSERNPIPLFPFFAPMSPHRGHGDVKRGSYQLVPT